MDCALCDEPLVGNKVNLSAGAPFLIPGEWAHEASRFHVFNHGARGQIEIGVEARIPLCRVCHILLLCSGCRELDTTPKQILDYGRMCNRCAVIGGAPHGVEVAK